MICDDGGVLLPAVLSQLGFWSGRFFTPCRQGTADLRLDVDARPRTLASRSRRSAGGRKKAPSPSSSPPSPVRTALGLASAPTSACGLRDSPQGSSNGVSGSQVHMPASYSRYQHGCQGSSVNSRMHGSR